MAFAPGTLAYVEIEGIRKTFDTWSTVFNSEVADVSDFDRRSAQFIPGLPSSTVTLSGPYSVGQLDMREGQSYEVAFGYTASLYVNLVILVQSIRFGTTVRGVARVEIAGIVTSDIENEDTLDFLYPNTTIEDL